MNNKLVFKLMDTYEPLSDEELKTATVEEIVLHNLRFAYTQSKKEGAHYPGLSEDEIIEAMFYATTIAANKWDPEKSKITSYISQYIRVIIKEMANENQHAIQRNTMYIWKSHVINKYVLAFNEEHGRMPTTKEISEGCVTEGGKKFSEKTVYNIYNLGIKSVSSFNVTTSDQDSDHDLNEVICDVEAKTPFDLTCSEDLSNIMTRLIAGLNDEEREVISRRWYDNHKYKEIADALDIPYPRVKKIEIDAMAKLKYELNAIEKAKPKEVWART